MLVFLLLAGGVIWFLLNYESGAQKLLMAREAMKTGAYPQAIEQFQDFLSNAPRHPEHSLASVQLAMFEDSPADGGRRLRARPRGSRKGNQGVEDEPAFNDSHEDLAALIPQIAEGLAKQAEKAPPTSEDSKKFVDLSNKALELCSNSSYVPKTLRDEAKLTAVRDTLERVQRRQQSQLALAEGLKAMEQAVADGKPIEAYAAHIKLMKEHPELADEKPLAEASRKRPLPSRPPLSSSPKNSRPKRRNYPRLGSPRWLLPAIAVGARRLLRARPACEWTARCTASKLPADSCFGVVM